MKLSIIVPVYNVEQYLSRCLESLLAQDLEPGDYEIICVNDGSTDTSPAVLEVYRDHYEQIRVISQENQGLSAARNAGMTQARGEYIWFVDSDDIAEENCIADLIRIMDENRLDKLLFDFDTFEEEEQLKAGAAEHETGERLKKFDNGLQMDQDEETSDFKSACFFLIRKAVLDEYGLFFQKGIYFEDKEFNFWAARCIGSCAHLMKVFYHYRIRKDGIVRSYKGDAHFYKYIKGRVLLAQKNKEYLEDLRNGHLRKTRTAPTEDELEDRWIDEVQGILNHLLLHGDKTYAGQILQELKQTQCYPYPMRVRRLLRKTRKGKEKFTDILTFCFPVSICFQLTEFIYGLIQSLKRK